MLAKDLEISRGELYKIVKFYRIYSIVSGVRRQLSWTHYKLLIEISAVEKRDFFEIQTIRNSWSYRELEKQLKKGVYEKTSKNEIEEAFKTKLPAVIPQKIFKDSYDFSFMGSQSHKSEREEKDDATSKTYDIKSVALIT